MPSGSYEGTLKAGERRIVIPYRQGRKAFSVKNESASPFWVTVDGMDPVQVPPGGAHARGSETAGSAVRVSGGSNNFPQAYSATEEW